ncbi:PrgI family protein, partial [Streptococcus suis]
MGVNCPPPRFIAYLDWRTFMNTRVCKDISKVQHRAWLGFTTRQVIVVFPAIALTILVLGLNLFYW